MEPKSYRTGEKIQGFIVKKSEKIREIQCVLTELVHTKTGALVMHLGNDDPENAFCLSFQTIPKSSNGVAHILEHTVLCGSKKFPVNDPFFSMHRRSLHTFMNAFTGSDFTCYPACTQIKKDFYNLLEVYIDSVFHPLLKEFSFLQEGWRLEFSESLNPATPLKFKGIVYNEMKGALSSSTTRTIEEINKNLYPNLTYGFNSGGDPKEIPTLTYDELLAFHRQFYHPSHCLFYFYGNFPLEEHLNFIAKEVLDKAEATEPLPPLQLQIRRTEPLKVAGEYPIGLDEDEKEKAIISFAWLTSHILEQEEFLALTVLDIILMATDASILKMALLRSGLCKQASAYLDGDVSEIPFVLILKGCDAANADALESLITDTLKQVVEQGINPNLIENAIHQLELHRSEISGDGYPFGLALFMRSALLKQHGGRPEDGLKIHSFFAKLLQKLKTDPRYFEKTIEKYLLHNPHCIRVTMSPSKLLATQELADERRTLDEIRAKMSPQAVDELLHKTSEFQEFQKQQIEQDLSVLPKMQLEDVPKEVRDYPLLRESEGNLEIFRHDCFTNSILYTDLVFPLPYIAEEDLPYVNLFSNLLGQLGCGGRSYAENLDYILAHTGGVIACMVQYSDSSDFTQFATTFHIKGKSLFRKADKLFPLIADMVKSVDFTDKERLREYLLKHYTALESTLNTSGLKYALNLALSGLSVSGKMNYQAYGLPYFWLIRDLAQHFDQKADHLIQTLERLQQQIVDLAGAHLVLSCDEHMYDSLNKHSFYGLLDLGKKPYQPWNPNYPITPSVSQGRIISTPVAFTGRACNTVSYDHPDAPALMVAAHLFDNIILHPKIREQGGAYNAGASSSAIGGHFYFYAGRDPNIATTVQTFNESVSIIHAGEFDEERMIEAKLETIQGMDSPVPPGSRAEMAYAWFREKRTQKRQQFRERMLSLQKKDIISALEKHIVPQVKNAPTVVFASKQLLEKEKKLLQQEGNHTLDHIETI